MFCHAESARGGRSISAVVRLEVRADCGGAALAVGLVYDPIYLEHDNAQHPENAERLRAVVRLLTESGLSARLCSLAARDATIDELAFIHDRDYVDSVRQAAERGDVWMDPDTYVCRRSYDAALRAAGGCLVAVDAVVAG